MYMAVVASYSANWKLMCGTTMTI